MIRFLTISAATAAILWSTNSPSKADLIVHNFSNNTASVAIAYPSAGTGGYTTTGWWNLEPGTTQVVANGSVAGQLYWIYAENAQAGKVWEGNVPFAVHSRVKFMIDQDVSCNPTSQWLPNGAMNSEIKRVGFEQIQSSTPDFHYNLQ